MTTRLGEKIRGLRKDQNLSLDALALKAGVSKSYLWELENREELKPSAEILTNIAVQLGTSLSFLMDHNLEPQKGHLDEVLFRNYRELDDASKERVRQIVEAFRKADQSRS